MDRERWAVCQSFETLVTMVSFKAPVFVDSDRFKNDPYPQLRNVETFLNAPNKIRKDQIVFSETKGFFCFQNNKAETKCLGPTKGRVHAGVFQKTEQKLRDFY